MVSLNFQGDLIKASEIGNIMKVPSKSTNPTKTHTSAKSDTSAKGTTGAKSTIGAKSTAEAKSTTGAKTATKPQSKAAFTDKMNRQVKEAHAQIDSLEKKAREVSQDLQGDYKKHLGNARAAQKKLQLKMEELGKAGEDSWENARDDVEHAWKAVTSSANYFKSQFKPSSNAR